MSPSGTTHTLALAGGGGDFDGLMPGLGAAMGGLGNRIVAEIDDATGTTAREYLWLGDRVVAVAPAGPSSATLYFVTTDHLMRPVQMTGASKAVVWRAKYGPFGELLETTGPASLSARYPGQWFQLENGLAWNWHRHYDASLGRYVQPDPLGLVDGPSVYGYVRQNPVMGVDPEGRFWWGAAAAALDIGFQLYMNGGDWRCIDLTEVGVSLIAGGLGGALEKGAFRFKNFGSHSWGATTAWMRRQGIQNLKSGQARHHWLFERNQGIGKGVPDYIKNQPWNTNPISSDFNGWLASRPSMAWLGGPGWAGSLTLGGLLSGIGLIDDRDCSCAQ